MIRINTLIAISILSLTACQTATEHSSTRPVETITLHRTGPASASPDTCRASQIAPDADYSIRFDPPCPATMDAEFIASLQRALQARGLYDGEIDGTLGTGTRKAIRTYQAARGLDSDILALDSARQLGLVAYPRPNTT